MRGLSTCWSISMARRASRFEVRSAEARKRVASTQRDRTRASVTGSTGGESMKTME